MKLPDDCTVRLADLPLHVGGFVAESPDGHLNIYVNARLTLERQRQSLRHELDHIMREDLHSARSIYEVECRDAVTRPEGLEIPGLIRASDLLPKKPPAPPPAPLTPYQRKLIAECLAAFDALDASRLEAVYWQ